MQNVVEVACSSPPVAMNATKPAAQAVQATGQDPFDLVLKQASERIVNDKQSDSAKRSSDSKSIDKNHGSGIAANEKTSQNNYEREVERTKKQEKTEQSEKHVVSEKSESNRRDIDKQKSSEAPSEQSAMLFGVVAPVSTIVENADSDLGSMGTKETDMDLTGDSVEMGLFNTTDQNKADVSADQTEVISAVVNSQETLTANAAAQKPAVESNSINGGVQAQPVETEESMVEAQISMDDSEPKISSSETSDKGIKGNEKTSADLKSADMASNNNNESSQKISENANSYNHGKEVNSVAQKSQEVATPDRVLTDKTVKIAEVETNQQAAPPDNPNGPTSVTSNAAVQTTNQISEPARLAEAPKNEIITQVANQIDQLVKSNRSSIRLQLYPEELGHIDLRIVTTRSGISVTMMTEKASTQQVLKSDMDMLKQNIEQAGIQLSNLNINQGNNSNKQQSFENRQNLSNGSYAGTSSDNSNTTSDEPRVHLTSTVVDYRV